MSLRRRGRIWWCRWKINGKSIEESTGTASQSEAQEYHDTRRSELWRESRLDQKPVKTWDDACLAWITEHAHQKKSYDTDRIRLQWITPHLTGIKLDKIKTALLTKLRDLKEGSPASRNRHLAVISAVLHFAHAREWLDAVPKIPYLKEPKGRLIYLTREQAQALLAELPDHLRDMAEFALATGMRRANVSYLEWEKVDLGRRVAWVEAQDMKAGKSVAIPLNDAAVSVLRRRIGIDPNHVFTWRGKPVFHTTTKAWHLACERAGLEDVTFHTLRHTWASWHVMAGTPLDVLMKLGAWADMGMVLRYAHLAPGYLANYAGNVGGVGAGFGVTSKDATGNITQPIDYLGWTMGLEPTTTGITIQQHRKKVINIK